MLGVGMAVGGVAAEPPAPQVAVVARLYHDFAFEAVLESPLPENASFATQPRRVLLRYLTPALAELVLRDRRYAAASHETCRLNFMPLWGNQDPLGAGVRVEVGAAADTVAVRLRYPAAAFRLTYYLSPTAAGWRIRDIAYEPGRKTLAETLEAQP